MAPTVVRWLRASALAAVMTAVTTGALQLCLSAVLDAVRLAPRLDQEPADRALGVVLGAVLGVLLLVALGWLVLAVTLCLAEALSSPHGTAPTGEPTTLTLLRPRTVRLVVAAVVGAGGLASPAAAEPVRAPAVVALAPAERDSQSVAEAHGPHAGVPVRLLVGLPLPDRRTGGLVPSGPTTDRPPEVDAIASARGAESVRVRRGDSLWGVTVRVIAQGSVDEPDAAVVDGGWRLLYAGNRAVVGPDPDLIQPGTLLEVPPRPPFTDPQPGAPR